MTDGIGRGKKLGFFWLCIATSAACSDGAKPEMTCTPASACDAASNEGGAGGASGAGGGAAAGAGGQGASGAVDAQAYSVTLEADDTTLCPGECALLQAAVANGIAPYRYAWSGIETEDGPEVEVCPADTTTYEITVTDSKSTLEEFGGEDQQALASLEIVVDPECDEDPPPVSEVVPSCELRIPHSRPNAMSVHTGIESQALMTTDSQGNALLVGSFQGTIDFGNGITATSRGLADGFVLKLSPKCEPLWVVQFGGTGAIAGLAGIAMTAGDEMFVLGSFTGSIDFGDGTVSTDRDSGVLLKLDASAGLIWKRVYSSGGYGAVAYDLGVTDSGDVVFGGYSGPDTDFGGGPIGGSLVSSAGMGFVARLSSAGDHQYSYALSGATVHSTLAVHGSGLVAVSSCALGPVEIAGESAMVDAIGGGHFLALLDDSGALLRSRILPVIAPPPGGMTTLRELGGASVVYASDRSLFIEQGNLLVENLGEVLEDPQRIVKLDSNDAQVMVIERAYIGDDVAGFYGGLALDSHGNIVHIDEISEGATVDGAAIAGAGSHDVYVEKLTPEGELIWNRTLGADTLDRTWAQAIDLHDSLWITYAEGAQYEAPHTVIVISKLAP